MKHQLDSFKYLSGLDQVLFEDRDELHDKLATNMTNETNGIERVPSVIKGIRKKALTQHLKYNMYP